MNVVVFPSAVMGLLKVPPSKSSMQRACAAALLHNGITHIYNAGYSNDDKAALQIIASLGAKINTQAERLTITSEGFSAERQPLNSEISCGESGLSVRMFCPIAALSSTKITLTGTGSLLKRPMNFFDKTLPLLGIHSLSKQGFLPIEIQGPIIPTDLYIDGSLSSQFLTGLLFALSNATTKPVDIFVENLKSKPYIDLTLDVMKKFGHQVTNHQYKQFVISPKSNSINDVIEYNVEADWSSASFLMVAAAINGSVRFDGLSINSSQADKAIMQALESCGAGIKYEENSITIFKKELKAFQFDATDCPDLFPPLAAMAAYCNGTSVIKGVHRLAAKESDRAVALQDIFSKMGVSISIENDEMLITGAEVNAANVSSHHDHRIAMAAAVAALGARGAVAISDAEAINKSYPSFFEHLTQLGGITSISPS